MITDDEYCKIILDSLHGNNVVDRMSTETLEMLMDYMDEDNRSLKYLIWHWNIGVELRVRGVKRPYRFYERQLITPFSLVFAMKEFGEDNLEME